MDALSGLTLETVLARPGRDRRSSWSSALTTGLTFGTVGPGTPCCSARRGVVTAMPLLFFAAASRRLPLIDDRPVQYLAPVLQFLVGVVVLHEPMPPERWIGFGLVWVALIVLTVDMIVAGRASRRRLDSS